jgi:hypothetical protein
MTYAKLARSPCATGSRLSKFDGKVLHDIAYSVNQLCQHLHHATSAHWSAVKQVLHFDPQEHYLIMVCLTPKPICSLMPSVTLIGLAAQIIDAPPQALLCVLVTA